MEDLVVSDVQHDIVERQRAKLQHHLSYLVRGMQVQTGRRALDDFEIREFEGKVHWQNIVHSCRTLMQLASDVAVMQTVYETPLRHRHVASNEATCRGLDVFTCGKGSIQEAGCSAEEACIWLRNGGMAENVPREREVYHSRFMLHPV